MTKDRLEETGQTSKAIPAGLDPRKLTSPTRHDPVIVSPPPAKRPLYGAVLSTVVKAILSAALILYLVDLQSKPPRHAFDAIVVNETTRAALEAAPMPGERRPSLVVLKSNPEGTIRTYGVGSAAGPLVSVRYTAEGVVAEKTWARGFWTSVLEEVKAFRWQWLFFVGAFHLIGYAIASWNWKHMILGQGRHARFGPLLGSNVVAGLFNNVLPSNVGGDAVRIRDSAFAVFGAGGQPDYTRATTVVILQRVIGVFALLLIALVAACAQAGAVFSDQVAARRLWALAGASLGAVAFTAWLLRARMLERLAAFLDLFRSLPVVGKVTGKLLIVLETATKYRERPSLLLRIFLTSLVLQLNVIVYYYFCTWVVDWPVEFLPVLTAVPLVVILMTIVPSINGVGVRDWGFQVLLGLPASVAIAFALVDVLWRLAWGVLGGGLLILRGPLQSGAWLVRNEAAGTFR